MTQTPELQKVNREMIGLAQGGLSIYETATNKDLVAQCQPGGRSRKPNRGTLQDILRQTNKEVGAYFLELVKFGIWIGILPSDQKEKWRARLGWQIMPAEIALSRPDL